MKTEIGGFTLIEVLITIVVLTFGLLGIASMQLSAKRSGFQAVQRTHAIYMAEFMTETIRANAGLTSLYVTAAPVGGGSLGPNQPACAAATCTPAERVARDLWRWERMLDGSTTSVDNVNNNALVNPRACVNFISSNAATTPNTGELRITVTWLGLENARQDNINNPDPDADNCFQANARSGRGQELTLISFITSPADLAR